MLRLMNRLPRSIPISLILTVAVPATMLMLGMTGCAESGPESPPRTIESQARATSPWRLPPEGRAEAAGVTGFDPATQIAVINDEIESDHYVALSAAIEQARRTAEEARERWSTSPAHEHDRWAVKWAAPLAEVPASDPAETVEYVWVRPVHWSPFRVEGVLASDPVHELESGRTLGELVSFPIEELADWVRYHTDDVDGPRDGGFTIDALTTPATHARTTAEPRNTTGAP